LPAFFFMLLLCSPIYNTLLNPITRKHNFYM
jgi:hypothetical protein